MTYTQFVALSAAAAERRRRNSGERFGAMFAAMRGNEKLVDQYVTAYADKGK